MKSHITKLIALAGCTAGLAGCTPLQDFYPTTQPAMTSPAPASESAKFGTVSAYFPTGTAAGSGLLVEKSAPTQVVTGKPFAYTYKVSNLTDGILENVSVSDRLTGDFTLADSDPQPTTNAQGITTWNLGMLAAKASKIITIKGSMMDTGSLITCGWATYTPVLSQSVRAVKPVVVKPIVISSQVVPATITAPIAIGDTTTYAIKITNPGPAADRDISVSVEIAPQLVPISTSIGSAIISNQMVYFATIPRLEANQSVTYMISAKAVSVGNAQNKFTLNSATLNSVISVE